MIWFIIGFVMWVGVTIYFICDSYCDWSEKFLNSLMALVLSFLFSFAVCLVASIITNCCAEIEYNVVSDTKIIALKDNQNISGSFYIMGGYVDEDLYYYYATETEFGYKMEKIKADRAYIKYTDGETHIERYKGEFANGGGYLLGFPMCNDRYIIYCPEGTVTNEFNVDLE